MFLTEFTSPYGSLLNVTPLQTLDWRGMWHVWISSGGENLGKKDTMEHRLTWEEYFEMDMLETGGDMNSVCLTQDKALCQDYVKTLMKFWIS